MTINSSVNERSESGFVISVIASLNATGVQAWQSLFCWVICLLFPLWIHS